MYAQSGAAWFTVTVWPAIVSVPLRAEPALTAIVNVTVPLSFPALPDVTEMNASLLLAAHAQPVACEPIVTAPVPPADWNEKLDGCRVNVQTVRGNTISSCVSAESDTVSRVVW